MKLKSSEKVSFSKFFPKTQEYIVLRGDAKSPQDFDLTIDIGDGDNKASFYFGPWATVSQVDMLKTMRDTMQQALEFYEKALNLPSIKHVPKTWPFETKVAQKPAKKPAAKKKKAASKK